MTRPVPMIPDKNLIKRRFEQAASTYEQEARVQQQVADRLLALLTTTVPEVCPDRVLEIGCCTGLLTEKVLRLFPGAGEMTACDLVAAFESCVCQKIAPLKRNLTFLAGDIEAVELSANYDLIISSSTLHWVHNLPALLAKLRAHLRPEGLLAFSLYGKDNMREIRAVTGTGLRYRDLAELRQVVAEHFEILVAEESRETLWFPDPVAILHHLRATGVNSIERQVWSRRQVQDFITGYQQRFSGEKGVPLTYHPLYLIARPKTR